MGSYRVLDALTTLSFDFPRRSKFFTKELINLFLLSRENNLEILSLKVLMQELWAMVSLFLQVIGPMR